LFQRTEEGEFVKQRFAFFEIFCLIETLLDCFEGCDFEKSQI
jgi:hypothetical protein